MMNLFRFESDHNAGSIELRQWSYLKTGLLNNLEKLEQHYQAFPISVASSHLLVRLIQTIAVSRTLSFDRYVANCSHIALSIGRTIGLTTSLSKGQLWDGVFYGKNNKEILIGHDTLFPITEVYHNWKQQQPITVLQHEETNTGLLVPDGRVSSTESGIAIIAINIPLLMAMYYRFNEEQDQVEIGGGARRTIYQFVHGYALTNMLRTHLDCVVFNRLYNRLIGTPVTEAVRKHSFFLTDYNDALDSAADQQLDYLRKMDKRFGGVMEATHLPASGNLANFSRLPSVPPTLQVFWAISLSRLKILSFLCLVQNKYEIINGRELGTIRKLMRNHQTKQVIHNTLGMEGYYKVSKYLDIPGIE